MGWKNCFHFRYNTKFEKRLLLLVAVLSGVILVMFICLLSSAHERGVCSSPECVRAATYVLDTVDPTVDPCDDFYNFACGTFLKNAFSRGQPTTMHYLKDLLKNKVKELVTVFDNERNASRMLRMQRKFYKACTNEKDIEDDGNKTFLKLLDELLGGWPVIKGPNWVEENFEWKKTMVKARSMGFFYEFYFRIDIYQYNNDTFTLWIRPPSKESLSLFYLKDEHVKLIAEIADDLGAQSVSTRIHLRSTVSFMDRLSEIIEKHDNDTVKRKAAKNNRTAIKNLDHKFIKISWFSLLKNITGLPLGEDDLVIFDVEDYFSDLHYLLYKIPKKIQANYMAWAVISTNIDYLTKNIREKFEKIQKSEDAIKSDVSRSDQCFKISLGLFQHVAESEYIRRYTPPGKRKYITGMIKNVKRQLEADIRKNSWMDQETKDNSIRHLRSIKSTIGWTDIVYNANKLEERFDYQKIKISSANLVDMARILSLQGANNYYKKLTYVASDAIEEYFQYPLLQVNAYYLSYAKTIILSTPLIQGFLFHEDRPRYMNYGSLGSIIGHELTHGITQQSIGCDSENDTSWTNKTQESFNDVSQCLIDEYDMYTEHLDGFSQNGTTSLEENLADYTGVNLAYTAYQEWVWHNKREENLPGVNLTPNQIFWVTASNFLCYDPKVVVKNGRKKTEYHGAPRFRVIGRLRNSPYFARDFNCPVGSKMNPEKKCRIFT